MDLEAHTDDERSRDNQRALRVRADAEEHWQYRDINRLTSKGLECFDRRQREWVLRPEKPSTDL